VLGVKDQVRATFECEREPSRNIARGIRLTGRLLHHTSPAWHLVADIRRLYELWPDVSAMSLTAPTGLASRRSRPTHREYGMGLIHIELFATLDLVGQSPGGRDEDPVGFPFGGWQAPLLDEVVGAQVGAAYEGTDALLLGRRTYEVFAAYWPYQEGGEDNEIATLFNSVPKYVASRGRPDLSWAGSTQLGPDLAGAVRGIRDRHDHVKVVGSLNLVQTLLREKLFDRLDLWVHPIVLGVGKKVFDGGAVPTNVTLLEPPVTGPKGTVYLRYGLADGTPGTGDMSEPDRGVGRDD
jgi:dihydrofolate reductase